MTGKNQVIPVYYIFLLISLGSFDANKKTVFQLFCSKMYIAFIYLIHSVSLYERIACVKEYYNIMMIF